jgi:D-alanyl-D-alanine carboxypeptidase (penicillin-binding protein 5/6)
MAQAKTLAVVVSIGLLLFSPATDLTVKAELSSSAPAFRSSARLMGALKPFGSLRGYAGAHSILLKDLSSGRTLYAYEADRRLSPASLTKIMTALVILDYGHLDDHVMVSPQAARAHKIRIGLRAGHMYRLEDLVKAMLITSANDACLAAVEHMGGSEAGFVSLMNAKAREMNLADTHFSNACGFDAPDHYSTAVDLSVLSEMALQQPLFRAFVREELEIISAVNANRSFVLRNTNRLLGRLPGVEGVKTGFTARAGRCVILKVSQGERQLLLVLMNARRRWNMASRLITYGLQVPTVMPVTGGGTIR